MSPKPDESVTLPTVAATVEVAARLIRSAACSSTSPPVDVTATPALTVIFSVLATAPSIVVTVTVPEPVVFALNVIGPVEVSVMAPAVLFDEVRLPSEVIVTPPTSVSCTLPLPELANARLVTAISRAFALPMPPTACNTKSCATMLSEVASVFPSVMAPPASSMTWRPTFESSFTATAFVSSN